MFHVEYWGGGEMGLSGREIECAIKQNSASTAAEVKNGLGDFIVVPKRIARRKTVNKRLTISRRRRIRNKKM
jgi:hypothetical protein